MIINVLDKQVFQNADWSLFHNHRILTDQNHDCEAICVGLANTIDNCFISKYPSLKYILSPTTGTNHIKIDNPNIEIINLDSSKISHIKASAEFTILLILSLLRKIKPAIDGDKRANLIGEDLSNKTVGILGFGRIGNNVATMLQPFNVNLLTHDRNTAMSKQYVLNQSEIVVVLVSGTDENTNYINTQDFQSMSKQPYFVNICRAHIVNDQALLCALSNKIIKGAAVDMVNNISIFEEYLKKNDNLIITPHIAGSTVESQKKACDFVIQKLYEKCSRCYQCQSPIEQII